MNIKYIFLLKKQANEPLESKDLHYEFLNELFEGVGTKSFEFRYEDKEYTIDYIVNYNEDVNMFKLTLSLDENVNESKRADILESIDKLIRKGTVRKNYNIIISYDEVSEFFSNKAHKLLNRFERKLRELVYIIMVKTFGVEWYKKTVTVNDDLDKRIKQVSKGKKTSELIESALQEMTLHDLEMYLFTPYAEMDFNELLKNNVLNESLLISKSKEDIVSMISACIPNSLWERFFKDIIDINDIQEKLEQIRGYRNRVAHSKDFYKKDYISCKNIIEEVVNKINIAVEEIETKEFYLEDIKESYYAYSAFTSIQKAFKVSNPLKQLQEQTAAIQKAFEMSNAVKQMQEQTAAIQKAFEMSNAVKQMQEQTAAIQKAFEMPNAVKQMQEQTAAIKKTFKMPNAVKQMQVQKEDRRRLIEGLSGVKNSSSIHRSK